MKKFKWLILIGLLFINHFSLQAQKSSIDSIKFFTDEGLIGMTLTTDFKKLQTEKKLDVYQPAGVVMRFPDSTVISEDIRLYARGHFRRDNCTIPPIMLNFHNPTSPKLNTLGKLKLVIGCGNASDDEQLILKEYLIYKIYNLLEEKSFRNRLVKVDYRDTRGRVKPFSQFAFLIEDDAEMAARNKCIKKDNQQWLTENTNRKTMTIVAVFEYMISNGDWSVPNNHNTRLIFENANPGALPHVVPYDFDHSGFVNAGYALPNELLGTETVTERVYRGFPRTMEELQSAFEVYRNKKEAITSMVTNFSLLKERTRKEIVSYLEEFYKTINDRKKVQTIFIDNARTK
jgi:hypothetical protein